MSKLLPPTAVERYFSLHYGINLARQIATAGGGAVAAKEGIESSREDTCIARHHNGVCVVCISPLHPLVRLQKKIDRIDYRVQMKEVKGKRKKGGIAVEHRTKLCSLVCESGEVYSVQCAIKGTLLEYNTALADNPQLVIEDPLMNGYLAVILPWTSKIKTAVDDLVAEKDYAQ